MHGPVTPSYNVTECMRLPTSLRQIDNKLHKGVCIFAAACFVVIEQLFACCKAFFHILSSRFLGDLQRHVADAEKTESVVQVETITTTVADTVTAPQTDFCESSVISSENCQHTASMNTDNSAEQVQCPDNSIAGQKG